MAVVKRCLWVVFALVLLSACATATPTLVPTPPPVVANQTNLSQRLDRALTRYAKNGDFSGVALVAVNGEIVLKKPYAFADVKKKIWNTAHTRFQLATVSKTLTA